MKKYRNLVILLVLLIAVLVGICFIPISASKLIPRFEEQISKDLGAKVHIEHLILQIGPCLKAKSPIIHILYNDGQKFAQLNNVKLYIPWTSVLKNKPIAKSIYTKSLNVRVNSDDACLSELVEKFKNKNYSDIPEVHVKNYKISYSDKENKNVYMLSGSGFDTKKIINFKNFKLKTKGLFNINDQKYINYDLVIKPELCFNYDDIDVDIINLLQQVKAADFNADIIADLRLYNNQSDALQASGFINIDNISVADKAKKDPKSFIYLTLLGDKAGILSNIYTSTDKKIYIEGSVNNSQKPALDVKVKTDEINLSDLYRKLKIFTNLSKYLKDLEEVNGIINANFTLKGDLNKIKSNGFMKISNGAIRANGIQIDKITSNIDFSNNTINISDATGIVKNSPIMLKGTIDKEVNLELLMDKVQLKYMCPDNWGVKNGIMSLVAHITGKTDNITHRENLKIDNLNIEKDKNSILVESIKFDTNKNNTAYIANVLVKTPETGQIKLPSMNIIVDEDKINIKDTNIYMPNSKLVLKGEVSDFNNNNVTFHVKTEGYINSSDVIRAKVKGIKYPLILDIFGNRDTQTVSSKILLENSKLFSEPSVVNILTKFEDEMLKIEDISISNTNGSTLPDCVKSNLKNAKKLIVTGVIENFKKPVFKNLRLFIPQPVLLHVDNISTQIKGDLLINGDINYPEIVGQVLLQNLSDEDAQLAIANCSADFNKNILTLNAPSIKIGDSIFGVNAMILTDIRDFIKIKNINIKSKYVNTDTLLTYKDLMQYPYEIDNGKFYSERLVAGLYENILNLTAFSSDFSIKHNILNLSNVAAEMYNGKLSGNIEFNMKDEAFKSNIMARGVSASPVFDLISTKKEQISGVMDFDSEFSGNINSKQSISGNLKFIVKNGRMSALGKLEHLLYAQNVVADSMLRTSLSVVAKAITLKDTGLFKYLRGDIAVNKGIANINALQSQGPLMSLFIKGQYNILNDFAKLVVLGRISDEVISGLGAFGDFSFNKLMIMLTGDETKYNVNVNDIEYLPQLQARNTKEFRSIINGPVDKPSSVLMFNWISYTQKSLRQKEVPMTDIKVPAFINELAY